MGPPEVIAYLFVTSREEQQLSRYNTPDKASQSTQAFMEYDRVMVSIKIPLSTVNGRTMKDQDNIGEVVLISIYIHVDENGSKKGYTRKCILQLPKLFSSE